MILRALPPARSAISLRAIAAGARAAASRGSRARDALTEELRGLTDCGEVLLTDSGTSALRVAIARAHARRGGVPGAHPVALPAFACFDVLSAAIGASVPLMFYDVNPLTLAPERASLEALAHHDLCGVVVVHAYGIPVDVASVRRALPGGTPVIEDAAQAWGSRASGGAAGTLGDYAIFSFGRGKGVTGGSGGALLSRAGPTAADDFAWNDADAGPAPAGWRDVAIALALWALSRPRLYGIPASIPALRLGETIYKPPHAVTPISRAAAGMVRATRAAADHAVAARRRVANRLRGVVERTSGLTNVDVADGSDPSWLRLPVLADTVELRDRLVRDGRVSGVAASYPQPLPDVAHLLGLSLPRDLAGADILSRRLFTLPTHDGVTDSDIGRLERLLARR